MQIKNFIAASIAAAGVFSEKIQNQILNGILVDVNVSGTGTMALTEFDDMKLNVILRPKDGDAIIMVRELLFTDVFKISDHQGGFSMTGKGAATGHYVAYLDLGCVHVGEEDILEVSGSFGAPPTDITMTLRIAAVQSFQSNEVLYGYERITGNGANQLVRNAEVVYLVSAAAGNTIFWKDDEDSDSVVDYDAVAFADAVGRSEVYQALGIIWNDDTGLTKNFSAVIPANVYAVAQTRFFPVSRVGKKAASVALKRQALENKIRLDDPRKYEYLAAYDQVGGR